TLSGVQTKIWEVADQLRCKNIESWKEARETDALKTAFGNSQTENQRLEIPEMPTPTETNGGAKTKIPDYCSATCKMPHFLPTKLEPEQA
ncbi:hypothetical protein Tco_0244068, partial [Tanacetum coccineum]